MSSADWVHVSNDWGSEHRPSSNWGTDDRSAGWLSAEDRHSSLNHIPDLSELKLGSQDIGRQEITRRHWVKNEDRPYCNNKQCHKKFTLIERQHHCRHCGEVFCNECVKYRRRLSILAHLDPEGKLYKVCQACFEEGHDNDVPSRSWMKNFKDLKLQCRQHKVAVNQGKSNLLKSWRDKLDLPKECKRLREGFMKTVGASEMKRTLHEVKVMITTPDWQKSANWIQESMSDKCQHCSAGFGLLKKKYTCKLCGRALCKTCIHKELLVYIPDDVNENLRTEAELVIIKVIGSPEVEPEISLLLHVCASCRQYVVDRQVDKAEQELRSEVKDTEEGAISKLIGVNVTITKLQDKIHAQMTKYQDIVESLEDSSKSTGDGSNTKVLAKAQDDLSDYFSTLVLKIPTLKKLQEGCETDTQRKLLRNYTKAKSDFYLDNINMFRTLRRKLGESAPPQVLEYIQKIVDKNAIVSAQIYIRQLVFESIHLGDKYKLKGLVPELLKPLDDAIEEEADTCLASQGEDLEQHQQYLMEIIKVQMKDHRVIRPSKRQLAAHGRTHAADILRTRVVEILEQVDVQLNLKSVNRSFQRTKAELETACKTAQQLQNRTLLS
ncbi:uncharacterized protein LOC123547224 [Mercenaria mercenaria]|uniref:uncharacterized protein LOC123547224 n=1 Tax=Mercenaria mercenaria TaxID=6596 RepID=UPI00234F7CFD|nr:uncharacterized protein LOC123547224 [Mercenaria mercenaria]XP_053407475.1 uncharacterized protein LOC123547224 [Mercenaria mercenaria]